MSIVQFLRIFWARRVIIAAATISCLIGAILVMLILPPRWTGTARVILDVLKPDPVTGDKMGGPAARTYIATQTALIDDYTVAGRVADQLGWLSDPNLIRAYRNRSSSDTRDFRHWIAQRVMDQTKTDVVQGSSVLEIHYTANTADDARAVAEALRRAYIQVNLSLTRDNANQTADWYDGQSQKSKANLDAAQTAVTNYERDNGIVMADEKTDIDSARLKSLAGQGAVQPASPVLPQSSAALQLAQVDAEIAQATKTLGPNHPELQTLRAKRTALAAMAAKDEAERATAYAKAHAETTGAVQTALTAQKTKVVAERDKLTRLNQLLSEAEIRKSQFDKIQAKAAEMRLQAAVTDPGITPLGGATVPPSPDFPNKPLIIFGSIAAGLGLGILVALLAELFARRVRSVEDLQSALDAPMLAVISGPASSRRPLPRRLARQVNWPVGRKAAQG